LEKFTKPGIGTKGKTF